MKDGRFLSRRDLEDRLNLHRNTIGNLLKRGVFPNAFKTPGGHWRVPQADYEAFVHGRRQPAKGGGA